MTGGYRVLLTTAYFEPGSRAGGPIKSVARTIDTADNGVHVTAVTRDRDLGAAAPYPGLSGNWTKRGNAKIYYLGVAKVRQWRRLMQLLRRAEFDLLYCNSLWEPTFTVLPVIASRMGLINVRKVLVAPRGELSSGALQIKRRKKSLVLLIWRRILASGDVTWHASTEMEARDIRRVWPDARVEIVEDQTDLPPTSMQPERPESTSLQLVYISRISPMKNLLIALQALARCAVDVDFSIYGPVEDESYWTQCQEVIATMPPNVRVTYGGPLEPNEVRNAFARYDAFIFPSRGENFGHVVAESLSASCPVVCSVNTPWTDVLNGGGGYALQNLTAQCLADTVNRLAQMQPDERKALRTEAGRAYSRWRQEASDENILDRMCTSSSSGVDQLSTAK